MSEASFTARPVSPLLDHDGVEAARLVHAARSELLSTQPTVTYAMLARARGQKEATVRQWARRLRLADRLVVVEHDGTTLIPSFQFDEAYEPKARVGDVVGRLGAAGLSGWAIWRWFTAVNPWVEERPVDLVDAGRFDDLDRAASGLVDA